MKKILFLSLILWLFIGCVRSETNHYIKEGIPLSELSFMCLNGGSLSSCQNFFAFSYSVTKCNDSGCRNPELYPFYMCLVRGNKEACQALFIKNKARCNSSPDEEYNAKSCGIVAMIYGYIGTSQHQLLPQNVGKAQAYKNMIFYRTKACMIGQTDIACNDFESIKMWLEQNQ